MSELEAKRPYTEVTAMVIGASPIGEYDRRVVLLTRETGKISAFAKGARRPNSQLVAATDLFVFGTFRLYAGRDSYTLVEASVQNYFSWFRSNMEGALLGQYFCEVLEYCTRENNDEAQLLLLLYQTLRALESGKFPLRLIRAVFELKTVILEGEMREPNPQKYLPAVMAALQHIEQSPVARLYTFTLDEPAQQQLLELSKRCMEFAFEHHTFRSLEILAVMDL